MKNEDAAAGEAEALCIGFLHGEPGVQPALGRERLTVQEPDAQGFGLAGSGVFVLHPPHTLRAALAEVLPYLVDALGQTKSAGFLLDGVAP